MAQEAAVVRAIRSWIFYADLSSLPKRRSVLPRFLAKELYIIRSFSGKPGVILCHANRSALTSSQGTTAALVRECRFDRRQAEICNFTSSPALIFLRFQMKIRSRYRAKRRNYRGTRDPHRAINTALRSGARDAFFIVFDRRARFTRVGLEKSNPTTFRRIMKVW